MNYKHHRGILQGTNEEDEQLATTDRKLQPPLRNQNKTGSSSNNLNHKENLESDNYDSGFGFTNNELQLFPDSSQKIIDKKQKSQLASKQDDWSNQDQSVNSHMYSQGGVRERQGSNIMKKFPMSFSGKKTQDNLIKGTSQNFLSMSKQSKKDQAAFGESDPKELSIKADPNHKKIQGRFGSPRSKTPKNKVGDERGGLGLSVSIGNNKKFLFGSRRSNAMGGSRRSNAKELDDSMTIKSQSKISEIGGELSRASNNQSICISNIGKSNKIYPTDPRHSRRTPVDIYNSTRTPVDNKKLVNKIKLIKGDGMPKVIVKENDILKYNLRPGSIRKNQIMPLSKEQKDLMFEKSKQKADMIKKRRDGVDPNKNNDALQPNNCDTVLRHNSIAPMMENPLKNANFCNRMFFLWTNALFDTGNKKILNDTDIYLMGEPIKSHNLIQEFNKFVTKKYGNMPASHQPSTIDKAYAFIRVKFWTATVLFVLAMSTQFAGPMFTERFLESLSNEDDPYLQCSIYILGLFGVLFIRAIIITHSKFLFAQCGTMLSQILRNLILQKLLVLNCVYAKYFSSGKIVNLMTVDVDAVINGLQVKPNFLGALAIIVQSVYSLVTGLKLLAIVVPILIMIVLILQKQTYVISKRLKHKILFSNDERIRIFSEMLESINIVKLCTYEDKFHKKFDVERKIESKNLKSYLNWNQISELITFSLPILQSIFVFFLSRLFVEDDQEFDIAQTYTIISILNQIKIPIYLVNEGFERQPTYKVAYERIHVFLDEVLEKTYPEIQEGECDVGGITFDDCDFGLYVNASNKISEERLIHLRDHHKKKSLIWSKTNQIVNNFSKQIDSNKTKSTPRQQSFMRDVIDMKINNLLYAITANIQSGENICVCGNNKSGKTLFLLSILQETELTKGELFINGECTYLSKNLLIIEDTIIENVLLGKAQDNALYKEVLGVCELDKELEKFEEGDNSYVNEKGQNIPYIMRLKICLARCLYSSKDIFQIDDFFDEVDNTIRRKLFQKIINYLKEKTIIYTTHEIELASMSDRIFVFSYGILDEIGTFNELSNDEESIFYTQMCIEQIDHNQKELQINNEANHTFDEFHGMGLNKIQRRNFTAASPNLNVDNNKGNLLGFGYNNSMYSNKTYNGNRVEYEKKLYGRSWKNIFRNYFFSKGVRNFIWLLILFFLTQSLDIAADYWIGAMATERFGKEPNIYIIGYCIFSCTIIIQLFVRGLVFARYSCKISTFVYKKLVKMLMVSKSTWYILNPVARIINRCTTEQTEVDTLLSINMNIILQNQFLLVGFFIVICINSYYVIACNIFMVIGQIYIIRKYLKTARCLKQITLQNRSHLISQIIELTNGLQTIRNTQRQTFITRKFLFMNDIFQNSKIHEKAIGESWVTIRFELLTLWFPVLCMINIMIQKKVGDDELQNDLWPGLKLSAALQIVFFIGGFLTSLMQSEQCISSIDRIQDYTDNKMIEHKKEEPPFWPSRGMVSIRNQFYKNPLNGNYQLQNQNQIITPKEKVAIIGGSGSGKHTLMNLIMGLADIDNSIERGAVEIDGINLLDIDLRHLRKNIVYLYDNPILFEGTVRDNIDPHNEFTDEEIIKCFHYQDFWTLLDTNEQEIDWMKNVFRDANEADDNENSFISNFDSPSRMSNNIIPKSYREKDCGTQVEDMISHHMKKTATVNELEQMSNYDLNDDENEQSMGSQERGRMSIEDSEEPTNKQNPFKLFPKFKNSNLIAKHLAGLAKDKPQQKTIMPTISQAKPTFNDKRFSMVSVYAEHIFNNAPEIISEEDESKDSNSNSKNSDRTSMCNSPVLLPRPGGNTNYRVNAIIKEDELALEIHDSNNTIQLNPNPNQNQGIPRNLMNSVCNLMNSGLNPQAEKARRKSIIYSRKNSFIQNKNVLTKQELSEIKDESQYVDDDMALNSNSKVEKISGIEKIRRNSLLGNRHSMGLIEERVPFSRGQSINNITDVVNPGSSTKTLLLSRKPTNEEKAFMMDTATTDPRSNMFLNNLASTMFLNNLAGKNQHMPKVDLENSLTGSGIAANTRAAPFQRISSPVITIKPQIQKLEVSTFEKNIQDELKDTKDTDMNNLDKLKELQNQLMSHISKLENPDNLNKSAKPMARQARAVVHKFKKNNIQEADNKLTYSGKIGIGLESSNYYKNSKTFKERFEQSQKKVLSVDLDDRNIIITKTKFERRKKKAKTLNQNILIANQNLIVDYYKVSEKNIILSEDEDPMQSPGKPHPNVVELANKQAIGFGGLRSGGCNKAVRRKNFGQMGDRSLSLMANTKRSVNIDNDRMIRESPNNINGQNYQTPHIEPQHLNFESNAPNPMVTVQNRPEDFDINNNANLSGQLINFDSNQNQSSKRNIIKQKSGFYQNNLFQDQPKNSNKNESKGCDSQSKENQSISKEIKKKKLSDNKSGGSSTGGTSSTSFNVFDEKNKTAMEDIEREQMVLALEKSRQSINTHALHRQGNDFGGSAYGMSARRSNISNVGANNIMSIFCRNNNEKNTVAKSEKVVGKQLAPTRNSDKIAIQDFADSSDQNKVVIPKRGLMFKKITEVENERSEIYTTEKAILKKKDKQQKLQTTKANFYTKNDENKEKALRIDLCAIESQNSRSSNKMSLDSRNDSIRMKISKRNSSVDMDSPNINRFQDKVDQRSAGSAEKNHTEQVIAEIRLSQEEQPNNSPKINNEKTEEKILSQTQLHQFKMATGSRNVENYETIDHQIDDQEINENSEISNQKNKAAAFTGSKENGLLSDKTYKVMNMDQCKSFIPAVTVDNDQYDKKKYEENSSQTVNTPPLGREFLGKKLETIPEGSGQLPNNTKISNENKQCENDQKQAEANIDLKVIDDNHYDSNLVIDDNYQDNNLIKNTEPSFFSDDDNSKRGSLKSIESFGKTSRLMLADPDRVLQEGIRCSLKEENQIFDSLNEIVNDEQINKKKGSSSNFVEIDYVENVFEEDAKSVNKKLEANYLHAIPSLNASQNNITDKVSFCESNKQTVEDLKDKQNIIGSKSSLNNCLDDKADPSTPNRNIGLENYNRNSLGLPADKKIPSNTSNFTFNNDYQTPKKNDHQKPKPYKLTFDNLPDETSSNRTSEAMSQHPHIEHLKDKSTSGHFKLSKIEELEEENENNMQAKLRVIPAISNFGDISPITARGGFENSGKFVTTNNSVNGLVVANCENNIEPSIDFTTKLLNQKRNQHKEIFLNFDNLSSIVIEEKRALSMNNHSEKNMLLGNDYNGHWFGKKDNNMNSEKQIVGNMLSAPQFNKSENKLTKLNNFNALRRSDSSNGITSSQDRKDTIPIEEYVDEEDDGARTSKSLEKSEAKKNFRDQLFSSQCVKSLRNNPFSTHMPKINIIGALNNGQSSLSHMRTKVKDSDKKSLSHLSDSNSDISVSVTPSKMMQEEDEQQIILQTMQTQPQLFIAHYITNLVQRMMKEEEQERNYPGANFSTNLGVNNVKSALQDNNLIGKKKVKKANFQFNNIDIEKFDDKQFPHSDVVGTPTTPNIRRNSDKKSDKSSNGNSPLASPIMRQNIHTPKNKFQSRKSFFTKIINHSIINRRESMISQLSQAADLSQVRKRKSQVSIKPSMMTDKSSCQGSMDSSNPDISINPTVRNRSIPKSRKNIDLNESVMSSQNCSMIFKKAFNKNFNEGVFLDDDINVEAYNYNKFHMDKELIDSYRKLLSRRVEQFGGNFTVTQRKQLILGKAQQKRPKILQIDSLSLQMDDVFDKILFEIVMKNFSYATIQTILNKLEMVHHFDKCVVLEEGRVMEIGKPANIMIRKNSYLVRMLKNRGGDGMTRYVKNMIDKKAKKH